MEILLLCNAMGNLSQKTFKWLNIRVLIFRKRGSGDLTMSVPQVHVRFKMRYDRHLVKTQMSEIWIHDSSLQSSALSVGLSVFSSCISD